MLVSRERLILIKNIIWSDSPFNLNVHKGDLKIDSFLRIFVHAGGSTSVYINEKFQNLNTLRKITSLSAKKSLFRKLTPLATALEQLFLNNTPFLIAQLEELA